MRGERQLLRLGEYLVRGASRRLPQEIREERYQEWAAELPAILHDPRLRLAPRRAVRMLGYAADTLRGSTVTAAETGSRNPRINAALNLALVLLLVGQSVAVAFVIRSIVREPGNALNYLQLSWFLLLAAWAISRLVNSTLRTSGLLITCSNLAGAIVNSWNAAQAPGNWVNYFVTAVYFLFSLLLLLFLVLLPRWLNRPGPGQHAARGKW
jgi:hypothetical protein